MTFFNGSTLLGTATLDGSGQSTLTTSALAVGAHKITGRYGGAPNLNPSTSPALTETIERTST